MSIISLIFIKGVKINFQEIIMSRKITEILKTGKILVSDGAWGTFLQQNGLKTGECPELWCIERADDILKIAGSYINADADIIQTCSFGGTSYKLAHYGLADRVAEINEAAAKISREAAGDKFVVASIGPTGEIILPGDEELACDLYAAFKEQALALERGGADAACIETMSSIDEAVAAIRAVKENTRLEIICTFTFELSVHGDYRTMMGVSPEQAIEAAVSAGADISGTNCGNGMSGMIKIIEAMRKINKDTPLLVHANAGLPQNINGLDIFPESPEDMAQIVPDLVKAGANIIGGCCGTTPAHISAIKKAVI